MSSRTVEHITWHARSPAKDRELNHPADGKAWKNFNLAHPGFAMEPRNEINDFVRSYDDELKANQSGITDKDIQLSRDQNFALWLKDKALNDVSIPSNVQLRLHRVDSGASGSCC
ncbi:hypothetical protein AAC387_Pa04g2723 [Persea americana]